MHTLVHFSELQPFFYSHIQTNMQAVPYACPPPQHTHTHMHAHTLVTDGGTNIAFNYNQHHKTVKTVKNVSFNLLKGKVLLSHIILAGFNTLCL